LLYVPYRQLHASIDVIDWPSFAGFRLKTRKLALSGHCGAISAANRAARFRRNPRGYPLAVVPSPQAFRCICRLARRGFILRSLLPLANC